MSFLTSVPYILWGLAFLLFFLSPKHKTEDFLGQLFWRLLTALPLILGGFIFLSSGYASFDINVARALVWLVFAGLYSYVQIAVIAKAENGKNQPPIMIFFISSLIVIATLEAIVWFYSNFY